MSLNFLNIYYLLCNKFAFRNYPIETFPQVIPIVIFIWRETERERKKKIKNLFKRSVCYFEK